MAAIDLAQRRLLNKYQPDPERSYNLPARYYTDPEIFEREKEAIFFKTWQFVGHVEDLPEPGCYITTKIFDQNVVIIRGKDGHLRAFYNVCSHRAHELLEGSGKEAKISCPYHGWTYELDGGLFSARGSEKVKGFEPSEFCLKTVRLEVFLNLIFVNLDPDAPSLERPSGVPIADHKHDVCLGIASADIEQRLQVRPTSRRENRHLHRRRPRWASYATSGREARSVLARIPRRS